MLQFTGGSSENAQNRLILRSVFSNSNTTSTPYVESMNVSNPKKTAQSSDYILYRKLVTISRNY